MSSDLRTDLESYLDNTQTNSTLAALSPSSARLHNLPYVSPPGQKLLFLSQRLLDAFEAVEVHLAGGEAAQDFDEHLPARRPTLLRPCPSQVLEMAP